MKVSSSFKTVIQNHLNNMAASDPLFAITLKKPNKNIDDCIMYILNQVKSSGCNGFVDAEIFGMAIHYYDEDNLKPNKKITAKVVVNHSIELTEEDKEKAKADAIEKLVQEEKEKRLKKRAVKGREEGNKVVEGTDVQISLF